jgi:hypothetical protein
MHACPVHVFTLAYYFISQGWREAVASSKAAASKLGLVASAQLLQNRCSLPPIALTSDLATWHHAQKLAAFASWVDYVQVSHVADNPRWN